MIINWDWCNTMITNNNHEWIVIMIAICLCLMLLICCCTTMRHYKRSVFKLFFNIYQVNLKQQPISITKNRGKKDWKNCGKRYWNTFKYGTFTNYSIWLSETIFSSLMDVFLLFVAGSDSNSLSPLCKFVISIELFISISWSTIFKQHASFCISTFT